MIPGDALIVLSPHLDDAAVSVGGLMARVAAEGREVKVVTIYTSSPPIADVPPRFRRFAIYNERRREDARALGSIGAQPVWLGFRERALLDPALRTPLGVFRLPGYASPAGFANLGLLTERITAMLHGSPRATVLAPLGVGSHVDHVETFLSALSAMLQTASGHRFLFYEDAYGLAARARRRHFLARRYCRPFWRSPTITSLEATLMLTVLGLAARGPRVWDLMSSTARSLEWERLLIPLGDFEGAKLAAVALYQSQMALLGGADRFCSLLGRLHKVWGSAEPLWRPRQVE